MASVESNKKVARAAKAGGGRSRRQTSTSWGYYGTLIGISVIGTGLIAQGYLAHREDGGVPYLQTEKRSAAEAQLLQKAEKKYKDQPKSKALKAAQDRYTNYVENNHIHAAYAVWDCTKDKGKEWLPPVNGDDDPDVLGIHAHSDGLIHAHPFNRGVTGRRAVLGKFFDATNLRVSGSKIVIPAKQQSTTNPAVIATKGAVLKSGAKCKSGKTAEIAVYEFVNVIKDGKVVKTIKPKREFGSPASIQIHKNSAYVFALIEKGKIPDMPPSVKGLEAPSDQISAKGDASAPVSTPSVPAPSLPGGSTIKPTGSTTAGSTVKGATTVAGTSAPTTVNASPTTDKAPSKAVTTVAPTTLKK
jgi:hypothetical protein